MKKIGILMMVAIFSPMSLAQACPSKATININSSNYSGSFNVELIKGTRPGSRLVAARAMNGAGVASFTDVCPGVYFFSFGTPDSMVVSTTRYFDIRNDGRTYNNPTITVFYSRRTNDDAQRVGSVNRNDL